MASERIDHLTPAGGAYSIATFLDEHGEECEKAEAARMMIREFDSADRLLAETFGQLRPDAFDAVAL